jgi:hypothetical protein
MKAVRRIREKGLRRYRGRNEAVYWREKDYLEGTVEAGAVILPTIGCRWGRKEGCTMCGYIYDAARRISQEEILGEFERAMEGLKGVDYLKIFTSGSFLDPLEIAAETRREIISKIDGPRRVQVESRPEFIRADVLEEMKGAPELEIGIGLETTNDFIREKFVNKGFTLDEFMKALEICKAYDVRVKVYLLVKPPFMGEREAMEDAITSAVEVYEMGVDRISFNPVNVQRGTLVEELWRHNGYRPPWLWSIVEVLERVRERVDIPILSHPIAAGKERGPHNCGRCDGEVYKAIMDFSITQNPKYLKGLSCDCIEEWRDVLELEGFDH